MCIQKTAAVQRRDLEGSVGITHHIWLPRGQTSIHMQAHADLGTFLTLWREKRLQCSHACFEKLANEGPVPWATCAMSLCQRVKLQVKAEQRERQSSEMLQRSSSEATSHL